MRLRLLFVFFISISVCVFAQSGQDMTLRNVSTPVYPSSTAASLGKYADIPVSYHTGVPNISIPIYTLREGPLELPISLSYHAGGIRVDETASPVGLGWSLNAGGMLSRTVNGGPDEGMYHSLGASPRNGWGFYKDGGFPLEILNCSSTPADYSKGPDGTCRLQEANGCPYDPLTVPCSWYYQDAAIGAIDLEPDIYTFNVAGIAGKFYFDSNRNIKMLDENGVYIRPLDNVSQNKYLESWMMIDPNGTKYFFGNYQGANAIERSYSDPNGVFATFSDFVANTTWYLTRIESINGDFWINFAYVDEYYAFGNRKGQTYSWAASSGDPQANPAKADGVLAITYVQGKRLNQITTSSGLTVVNFLPAPGGREDLNLAGPNRFHDLTENSTASAISKIEIITPALTKRYRLHQSYFNSYVNCFGCPVDNHYYMASQHKKRLRLDQVVEEDEQGNSLPPYVFTYNLLMPSRYSLARDQQGYYNGQDSNDGWIHHGTQIANYSFVLATDDYRFPSEIHMQAGVLGQIKYPTGKQSMFTYEAHRTAPSSLLGGLRIKGITESDPNGWSKLRLITYENPQTYFDTDNYYANYVNQNLVDYPRPIDLYKEYFSTGPIVPLFSTLGYHIAYDKVTESVIGNGKTITSYYSFLPQFPNNPASRKFPAVPVVMQVGTGALKKEDQVNESNATVASTEYLRTAYSMGASVIGRRVALANRAVGAPEVPPMLGAPYYQDYSLPSSAFLATSEVVTQQAITTTTTYSYNSGKIKPNAVSVIDSEGKTLVTEIMYPGDVGSSAPGMMHVPDVNQAINKFKNMIYEPLKVTQKVNGVVTHVSENQFAAQANRLVLEKKREHPTGTVDFIEAAYEYDANSNPAIKKNSDGTSESYLWGYGAKSASYPVAIIKNAAVSQVALSVKYSSKVSGANVPAWTPLDGGTFYVTHQQQIIFTVNAAGAPDANYTLRLVNVSGVEFFTKTYLVGSGYSESVSLPAGSYQYEYKLSGWNFSHNHSLAVNTNFMEKNMRPVASYTSFEENGVVHANAKTGIRVHSGYYHIVMPSATGTYSITYWQRPASGGEWTLQEQSVTTLSATPPDQIIGQPDYLIDEVRMYPSNAEMTTFTYGPGAGVSSVTDGNNKTLYYEYDSFGRLVAMKDSEHNILKTYTYNYKIN